jgi:broad specificity phosphatase PhoE
MSTSKIEKIVYFVRHAQSEDNVAPVFQSPNSPLNEKGKRQAERIAERISKLHFGALIASHFERAKQTAEAITRATGRNAEYSDLFVERVKPTYINGKPYTDETADKLWREWQKSLYTSGARAEDGENFDDLLTRVARVLLGSALSGEAFRQFQKAAAMENTGLTVLRYHVGFEEKSSWRLWIYNDHAHLG